MIQPPEDYQQIKKYSSYWGRKISPLHLMLKQHRVKNIFPYNCYISVSYKPFNI